MSFFYKEFDFPPIPSEIIANLGTVQPMLSTNNSGYGLRYYLNGEPLYPCGYHFGKVTDDALIKWLKENIPGMQQHLENSAAMRPGVYMQTQTPSTRRGSSTHIVHTDVSRIAALNYHWDLGGDAVTNRWYKEKDKPIVRPKDRPGVQSGTGKVDYKDLETLAEIKTKAHRWYMLNTVVLHDVQNIKSQRQGLTICFENNSELEAAGFTEYP